MQAVQDAIAPVRANSYNSMGVSLASSAFSVSIRAWISDGLGKEGLMV